METSNLANLEALLNIIANGCEIVCLAAGMPLCLSVPIGIILMFKKKYRLLGLVGMFAGPMVVAIGLATPGIINFLVTRLLNR